MRELRKVDDELEARRCLAAAKAARQTPGEWARSQGVDGRSLNAWRMNLSRRGTSAAKRGGSIGPRLVELVPTSNAVGEAGGRYVVRVGATAVEFGADFDESTLARVLTVLRAC